MEIQLARANWVTLGKPLRPLLPFFISDVEAAEL